jgi:hypothetical protein
MTEEPAVYEVKLKKIGRPPKDIKGERLWIPAECVEFVKTYLELHKQKKAHKETNP